MTRTALLRAAQLRVLAHLRQTNPVVARLSRTRMVQVRIALAVAESHSKMARSLEGFL